MEERKLFRHLVRQIGYRQAVALIAEIMEGEIADMDGNDYEIGLGMAAIDLRNIESDIRSLEKRIAA